MSAELLSVFACLDGEINLFVVEDVTEVFSKVTGIDVLVGFRSRLGVLVPARTPGPLQVHVAVERIVEATLYTVGLEIVGGTYGLKGAHHEDVPMPDETANADRERNSKSNVVSLRGRRDADGTLTGVECRVEYYEARDPEPEKWDFQCVVSADIDYSVEDGVARLCSVSDRDAEGAVEPGLLRVLPAGEAAVASVPGVERTERVEDTLGAVIEAGRKTVSDDE